MDKQFWRNNVQKNTKSHKDQQIDAFLKFHSHFTQKDENWNEERFVWGIASTEVIDQAWDIVTFAAMRDAWADYSMWGNIREMHQDKAVWTMVDSNLDENKKTTFIMVKIVDDEARSKITAWVYKWFSIWAYIEDAEFKLIDWREIFVVNKIKLIEISIVDRPCNQEAKVEWFKFISLSEDKMSKLGKVLKSLWLVTDEAQEEKKDDLKEEIVEETKEEKTEAPKTDEPTIEKEDGEEEQEEEGNDENLAEKVADLSKKLDKVLDKVEENDETSKKFLKLFEALWEDLEASDKTISKLKKSVDEATSWASKQDKPEEKDIKKWQSFGEALLSMKR